MLNYHNRAYQFGAEIGGHHEEEDDVKAEVLHSVEAP